MASRTARAGTPLLMGTPYLCGDVEVLVHVADVDVDEDEVLVEERRRWGLVEVDVEDLAVAAPVAAEVEDDALVLGFGLLEAGGYELFRIGGFVIEVALGERVAGGLGGRSDGGLGEHGGGEAEGQSER